MCFENRMTFFFEKIGINLPRKKENAYQQEKCAHLVSVLCFLFPNSAKVPFLSVQSLICKWEIRQMLKMIYFMHILPVIHVVAAVLIYSVSTNETQFWAFVGKYYHQGIQSGSHKQ